MAWSYRTDRMDEVYHNKVGPGIVDAVALPDTPASMEDALNMGGGMDPQSAKALGAEAPKKEKVEGEVTVTQFQEYPGQSVPRMIVGEGETKRDKEIVKAVKEEQKRLKEAEKELEKENKKEVAAVKK